MMKRAYYVDIILVFISVIWGVNPTVVKIGLRYIPVLQFNVMRLIIATVTVWTFVLITRSYKKIDKKDIKSILLVSIGGFFIFQWFYTEGISKTTAGNAIIIMGMLPLIVLTINNITGLKKARLEEFIGVLTSFVGMAIVVIGTGKVGLSFQNLMGCTYMLIACMGYAVYTVFSKPLSNKYSPYQITAYAVTITAVLVIIFTPHNKGGYNNMNSLLIFSLLFTGIMGICVGNFLYIWCIGKTNSNRVSVYNNLQPVFAVISGIVVLKETFTYIQFAGAIVILVGLYISTYRNMLKRKDSAKEGGNI